MSNIDNSKLVLELFNYKKSLPIEKSDIERILDFHIGLFQSDDTGKSVSQKTIVESLNKSLYNLTFDETVKSILEKVNTEVESDSLFYELENLYRLLENSNDGMMMRHAMQIVLDIINEGSDDKRKYRILTELKTQEWIPAVKNFLYKYTTNPNDRLNMSSEGGKVSSVYSIVEKMNEGFLSYIGDRWFIIKESSIEPSMPSNHTTEVEKLREMNNLEIAMKIASIDSDKIVFDIEESNQLGIEFKSGDLILNNEKCDKETTIESIFQTPIVSFMRRDLYPIIKTVSENLDKFTELDIVQRVTNITKPYLECYSFNYKDSIYLYSIDRKFATGSKLFQYESAVAIVNEVKQELGFDLTQFYKDKFSDDSQKRMNLEDKHQVVIGKISEINEAIQKLEDSGLLENSNEIKVAHSTLLKEKEKFESKLNAIKSILTNEYKTLV